MVVGAGPAGCTAALLLADFGIPVTLLDRRRRPQRPDQRVHGLHRDAAAEGRRPAAHPAAPSAVRHPLRAAARRPDPQPAGVRRRRTPRPAGHDPGRTHRRADRA
ncbi:MAG: FAD-dependent monooxygenase, partial [Streptosporangiaceae bacterium]